MSFSVEFRVIGEPEPKGSWVPFINPRTGRTQMRPDNPRSTKWEHAVRLVASRVKPAQPLDCPVRLEVEFSLLRPENPKFSDAPAARLDLDKLVRTVGDALTGLIYRDDSRITELVATKKFATPPGARIRVISLDHQEELPGC